MCQHAVCGWNGWVVLLDDLCADARLAAQLERRLQHVGVDTGCRVQPGHGADGLQAFEAAIANQPSHDGSILLLDPGLIVLAVSTRPGDLKPLLTAPAHDAFVHEDAVVVEVNATHGEGEQLAGPVDGIDDQGAVSCQNRQALRPASGDVREHECLNECSRKLRTAMRNEVDFQVSRCRITPVAEGANRHRTTDYRTVPGSATPALAGG